MSDPSEVRTIPQVLRASAETYGDAPAIMDGDVNLTFAELREDALVNARGLAALGVRPGDRVAVWAPNSHRWIRASLGVLCAGGIVVPLNTRYRGAEVREFLARTQARGLLVEQGFLDYDHLGALFGHEDRGEQADFEPDSWDLSALEILVDLGSHGPSVAGGRRVVPWDDVVAMSAGVSAADGLATALAVNPNDLSEIIFTSGTTGRAKGVQLTHGAPIDLYRDFGQIIGVRPGDRHLITLPFFHGGGNKAGMLLCLLHGVTMVPMAVFDTVEAMAAIEQRRISVMNGPPTIYISILDHPRRGEFDLSSLRIAATGAAVVPERLVERARTELPFENFITAYGLTECSGTATMCRATDPTEVVATSNGSALPGVEVRVADERGVELATGEPGEVLVRGSNLTPGYWQDPEATAATIDEDGWLHTGDIGVLDDGGNLKIVDRLKDLFIVGGFNVSPAEVEQVLARHPDVSEVAVIGVPDGRLGEVARAYIIPKPGTAPAEEQIIAWTRERLANFKAPRSVVIVDDLPRNASGKVLKRELRSALAGSPAEGVKS